jgi:hypothetical protein
LISDVVAHGVVQFARDPQPLLGYLAPRHLLLRRPNLGHPLRPGPPPLRTGDDGHQERQPTRDDDHRHADTRVPDQVQGEQQHERATADRVGARAATVHHRAAHRATIEARNTGPHG